MCHRSTLRDILQRFGLHLSRGRGQNFLVDASIAESIAQHALTDSGSILEIGPGAGALSQYFLAENVSTTAIEVDHGLCRWLREGFPGLKLIEADALDVDWPAADVFVSSVPYAVAGPILAKILESGPYARVVLIVQRELGDRLMATPPNRRVSSLTISWQLTYQTKLARRLPAALFFPVPDVESVVLLAEPVQNPLTAAQRRALESVLRPAFQQRRKQLSSSLSGLPALRTLEALGWDLAWRPEAVPLDFWRSASLALTEKSE